MRSLVIERINSEGPLPFDEFMEMCLYDPDHGYFTAGPIRPGERGDFVTAPEVSPHFGRCVANWVTAHLPQDPVDWALVEVGAGSGALLQPLVERLPNGVNVYAVERSEAARRMLEESGAARVVDDIALVTEPHAAIVMNEAIDNMPAAIVRRTAHSWDEVVVDADGDRLVLVDRPGRGFVADWASQHLPDGPVGKLVVAPVRATEFLRETMEQFDGIALCVIDYGGRSRDLFDRTDGDLVRTYRHQRTGFDFLTHPGETDVTVDMNIDVVAASLTAVGATVHIQSQRAFLNEWGIADVLATLIAHEHAQAAAGDVMEQLLTRSQAVAVRALVDERGFGAYWVVTASREPVDET